jgi:pimeloyl-ACP methyl ester carboxylesterase
MQVGVELPQLRDNLIPAGALDRVLVYLLGYPLAQQAYSQLLSVLGIGGYRDEALARAGAVDWGEDHFTCFQFDYDWRRDIAESAVNLNRFIREKRRYVQREFEKRYGIKNHDVKFDIVAHSMGSLVSRYYLRYGTAPLPQDGSLPPVTWAGARYVEKLVMIGPPNAGSIDALESLVNGYDPSVVLPAYPPAVIGTMPSLYQLLPRSRHQVLLDPRGLPAADLLSPELWQQNGWGLADPKQDKILKYLLPEVAVAERRRQIALDHLAKVLQRARQFAAAMDQPAKRPRSLRYYLIAGDAERTKKTARFNRQGRLTIVNTGPGDGVVLRSSALLDERPAGQPKGRLVSPIRWDQVFFVFAGHVELTRVPVFTDNLLFILLESPRPL